MCDPAEMCDGVIGVCPPDMNPLCPWAFVSDSPPVALVEGQYCGVLSDNSLLAVVLKDQRLDAYLLGAYPKTLQYPLVPLAYVHTTMFIDGALLDPNPWTWTATDGDNQGWFSQGAMKLQTYDNSSITMSVPWSRPPYINATSQSVRLTTTSCFKATLPAGKYCGSWNGYSEVLQVDPRTSDQSPQTGRFFIASGNYYVNGGFLPPVRAEFHLTFISYDLTTGTVLFASPNATDTVLRYFLFRILFDSVTATFKITAAASGPYVTLSTCQTLPVGRFCSFYTPRSGRTTGGQICINVASPDAKTAQIDMVEQSVICDNVTASLTYPYWSIDPMPPCILSSPSVVTRGIHFDFQLKQFRVNYVGFDGNGAPGCAFFSPLCCGSFNNWTYAARMVGGVLQAAGYHSPTRVAAQSSKGGVGGCQSLRQDGGYNQFYAGLQEINAKFLFFDSHATAMVQQYDSSVGALSHGQCFTASKTLTAFVGTANLSSSEAGPVPYFFGTLLVNSSSLDNVYGITVKISNSTNLVCSLSTRGIIVAGGSIIFANTPQGTCDDTAANAVNFSATMSKSGGVLTVNVTGLTSYSGLSVPLLQTDRRIPSGSYCADLGSGDFVVVRQNANGTTTIFASVNGNVAKQTLWTDANIFGGIVNRTTDATPETSAAPFPVSLMNFTDQGYVLSYTTGGPSFTANAQTCGQRAAGKFCGVSDASGGPIDLSYISNTSFATMSLVWNAASQMYTTSLFASRRVSASKPLNVTFYDHPWMLPFYAPGATLVYGSSWTVSFADGIGPLSVTMSSIMCGSAQTMLSGSYSGIPLSQADLEVIVNVTYRSVDSSSFSMSLYVLNATSSTRAASYVNGFVIDSKVLYWAGATQPAVMLDNVSSLPAATLGLIGQSPATLTATPLAQVPYPDQYYCGSNGSAPWTLMSNMSLTPNGEFSFRIAAGSGTGMTRLSTYWLPPMSSTGGFVVSRTVGTISISGIRYFANNDTFVLTTTSTKPATVVVLTRGKCSVVIPNGDYCAYDDLTNAVALKLTIVNSTIFTRLPKRSERLQCVGAQGAAGGLYECLYPAPTTALGYIIDSSPLVYSLDGGTASLTYSAGQIKISFSLFGALNFFFATQLSCNTLPSSLRLSATTAISRHTEFSNNTRLAVNASGTVFVADVGRHCIFTVDPISGFVALFAGQCDAAGYQDGNGPDAMFNGPTGIAFDASGQLYVLDSGNARIRAVAPNGSVTSFSGNGVSSSVDGTGSSVSFLDLSGITLHPTSNRLYVSEAYRIRIVNQATSTVKTFVGSTAAGYVNASGTSASLNRPGKVAFADKGQTIYFVDSANNCLRKVSQTGAVVTVAGSTSKFLGGFIHQAGPQPSLFDASTGNVLIIDNGRVWVFVVASGAVTTYNGSSKILVPRNATDLAATTKTLYISDGSLLHGYYL